MGNTLSSMTSIPNVVNADYKLVGKTTNIRWGELFEMRNIKTGQYTFMQEKYAVNLEVHQKNVQDCSYRVSLVHKNLATIYGFAHNDNLDSFTNTFKLCIFFEHTPSNLSEVIRAHKTTMLSPQQQQNLVRSTIAVKYFDESELFGYMDQLIDVLSFLQNNGINQGDITPEVCMVSSNGSVKLLDKKLIFNDTTSFALAGQGLTNVFLTPAELEALSGEESQPFENRYKADVFRLGMTLLECATLKKSAQIYDWSNYVIDLELLATRLAEVRERYSTSVYGPLREMLRFEEHKRPDFKQLRQSMQEDFNRTLLTTASMITPRGGNEENLKKSMGPKLVTSGSPRPDMTTLSRNKAGSHNRVSSSQDMMETFKSAFKDVFDIGKKSKAQAKKEKREEDLDDDMVEMDENMKINQVPYTEEAKLTVVSNNDGRLYKTSSMKVAAVDRFGEEDARGDTRLFKTMSVSDQVPWNSKVNLLKDNGTGAQQKERRRGSIFGAQKTEGESKSMAVRPHSRTVLVPETSSSSHYEGINFQNAINFSQVNNGGQYGEHYKTSIPPVQMAKSQTSYHSFPTTDERQDTVSGNLSSRLKFNENFQTSYIPAVDDSPVSLHSQRYHTARDYDPAQSTGDIYDPEGYKKQGYKPSFKLNLSENRYGLDDYGTKSWSTTTRENDRYNKYVPKEYEVHSSRQEYPDTKTTSYLGDNNTYTTAASKPKVEKSLEAIKHPINDYLKTITSGSSLSYNTKSPLMYEHSRQQSYSGVSQAGYIDTGIKPYALTTTSSKLESIIGRKDYSPILEKSSAKEDDQYSGSTIGKGSAGLKIGEFQSEKPETTNINDRFEQAMERSRRSKGFVRDMSTAMNRSNSRTGSVERGASGFTSGIMSNNLVGLKIKQ